MNKLKYILWFVFLLIVWAGVFFYTNNKAKSAISIVPENLVQAIYDKTPQFLAPTEKSQILRNFCNAVMSEDLEVWFQNNWFYYVPSKSIFLYFVCKDFGKYNRSSELWWSDNILKIKAISDLKNMKTMYKWTCAPSTRMTNCDFGNYYHLLYEHIINDYINIKLANAYGYINSSSIKSNIKSFMEKNFGDNQTACLDEEVMYINKSRIAGEDSASCSHPKTYKILSDYIINVAKLVDKESILKYSVIIKARDCHKITDFLKDTISCKIVNTGTRFDQDSNLWFTNIVRNEYFWYWLLNTYTMQHIASDIVWDSFTDSTKKESIVRTELYSLDFYQNISEASTNQSIDMLYQTIQKFPLHIWFLAYYEDVQVFRNKLAQLYTPLAQLKYKLMNVQNKDSK